jgi:hypothetical protein
VPRWDYKNVNTHAQTITNKKGNTIAPLNPDSFHRIYKLSKPLVFLNKGFLENFTKENPKPLEILQDWWDEETPFVSKLNRVYNTQYFKPPYQLLISMICRLYGEENCIHFKQEWTTMAHAVVEKGAVFNWVSILSPTSASTSRRPTKAHNQVFICLPFSLMLFVHMSLTHK